MLIPFGKTLPRVGENTLMMPNVTLLGNVTVGKGCILLPGVVIRADRDDGTDPAIIGDECSIQDNVCIHVGMGHSVIVGDCCSIGHGAILHGCEIGEHSLIGMGSIIMTGAKIGKNCLVAAGALVTEGTVIPDGHLAMGSPVKVIKPLRPEQMESTYNAYLRYMEYKKGYEAAQKKEE